MFPRTLMCGKSSASCGTYPMRRSRAGRSMPSAEEKSGRSPIAMRPARGVLKPAIASSTVVFPDPDGPTIATTRPSTRSSMRRVKPSCTSSNCSVIMPDETIGEDHCRKTDGDRDREQHHRLVVVAGFGHRENRDGQRPRAPGNRSRHHDRRAELADGARKREERSRDNTPKRERQADREEHARRRGAERLRDVLIAAAHLLEAGPPRADEQRQPHHHHRDDDRLPGEDDVEAGPREQRSDRPAPSENLQKNESRRDRRHDRKSTRLNSSHAHISYAG